MTLRKLSALALFGAALMTLACSDGGGSDGAGGTAGAGAGSSGGDACAKACQRLESCSPGTVCTISGDCVGQAKQIADCINSASCDQTSACLLGGSGGGGGTGNVGGGGTGALPGSGGSGAGGSGGTPSGGPTNCVEVCDYQPKVSDSQAECAAIQAELAGYSVSSTPQCYGINSPQDCVACYAAVGMPDGQCVSIWNTCYN